MIKGLSMFFGPPHEGKNHSKQLRLREEKVVSLIKLGKKLGFTHYLFNGYLEKPYFPYAHLSDELNAKFWYHLPYHWGEKPKDEKEMWQEVRKSDFKNLETWTVGCEVFGGNNFVKKLVQKNHEKVKGLTDKKTCYDHHALQLFNPTNITDYNGLNAYAPLQGLQWSPESTAFLNENYKTPVRQVAKGAYHFGRVALKPFRNSNFLTEWTVKEFVKRSTKPIVITEFSCRGEPKIIDNYFKAFKKAGVSDYFYYNISPYIKGIKGISDEGFSRLDHAKTRKYFKENI